MKQTETANFLAMIKTAYPFFEVTEAGVRLWHTMLSDLDYKTAQKRLANHIRFNKFAPTISEIVNPAPYEEKSFYQLLREQEEQERLALEEYNEKAVPMPEYVRVQLKQLLEKRVNRK